MVDQKALKRLESKQKAVLISLSACLIFYMGTVMYSILSVSYTGWFVIKLSVLAYIAVDMLKFVMNQEIHKMTYRDCDWETYRAYIEKTAKIRNIKSREFNLLSACLQTGDFEKAKEQLLFLEGKSFHLNNRQRTRLSYLKCSYYAKTGDKDGFMSEQKLCIEMLTSRERMSILIQKHLMCGEYDNAKRVLDGFQLFECYDAVWWSFVMAQIAKEVSPKDTLKYLTFAARYGGTSYYQKVSQERIGETPSDELVEIVSPKTVKINYFNQHFKKWIIAGVLLFALSLIR